MYALTSSWIEKKKILFHGYNANHHAEVACLGVTDANFRLYNFIQFWKKFYKIIIGVHASFDAETEFVNNIPWKKSTL